MLPSLLQLVNAFGTCVGSSINAISRWNCLPKMEDARSYDFLFRTSFFRIPLIKKYLIEPSFPQPERTLDSFVSPE